MSGAFARAAGRALPAGAAAAVAGSAFHRAFGYGALALPLAVATLVPVVLVVVAAGGRRRLPVEVSLPLSAGLCLLAGWAVLHGFPHPGGAPPLGALPRTAVEGWAVFLDVPLPAVADPVLLAVPFTATWTAAAAGAELAVRARRVTAATLPAFVLLVVAVALCLPGRGSLLGQVVALGAVAAATQPRPVVAPRTAWLVLGPVGVTAMAAVVLSTLWPTGPAPYDPREHRPAVEESASVSSPLAQYAQWEQRPDEALFTVERGPSGDPPSSGPAAGPERWRLASLTSYDGREWTLNDVFTPVFGPLPADPVLGPLAAGRAEGGGRSSAVIRNLTGRLVPVPDAPVALRSERIRLSFNRFERTALAASPLAPDARFGATGGAAPAVTPAEAAGLSPASGLAQALDVPGSAPPSLRELADRTYGAASTPFGRAQALASELSREYRRAANAPLSQPIASLSRFLADRKGSAVDFAAAYALAARLEGLPCRIVVGFRVPAGSGTHTVLARDAALWTEVAFDRVGWLPFDPVPAPGPPDQDDGRPEPSPVTAAPVPSPSPSPSSPSSLSPAAGGGASPTGAPQQGGAQAIGTASRIPWGTWATAALAALAVSGSAARAWLVLVRPVVRRRAGRRAATSARRVLAAWLDARHAFDAAGAEPPDPSRTLVESARLLSRAEPVAAVRASAVSLAQLATRARFCEPTAEELAADPSLDTMGPQDAELAWLLAESIRDELRPERRLRVLASSARVLLPAALSARVLPARALPARPRTEEERVEQH
ncbi:transglutaminase domain-containing protein [Streptomyces sp. NPDC059525]|uniref:transglutaminase domain-containing protein n=1 Tax=Streptomyces sp. NPDC059525 TaxID=3346857 RepID=UPI0036AB4D6C